MTSELKKSYLPPSYHNLRKRHLSVENKSSYTKNKIKVQIAEKTKIFIPTYGTTFVGDGWSSVNNHPLLNIMCVSPSSKEFMGAIIPWGIQRM
jgi:hypothetical protein